MLECVINVAEGRRSAVIEAIATASGASLLDVHVDPDHHRSVFTLAGPGRLDARDAARRCATAAAERIDLRDHSGVHPRLGVIDVVPFVALAETTAQEAVDAAHSFAEWIVDALAVPVFFYGAADNSVARLRDEVSLSASSQRNLDEYRTLPEVRRRAFRDLAPDVGPARGNERLGATAVGVRPVLVAINCELAVDDPALAKRIAGAVRERDGGLAGVRALGFRLDAVSRAQVSMNLVDLERTGVESACRRVRELARSAGTDVARVELVGLLPERELARCSNEFLSWSGLQPRQTIEARLAACASSAATGSDADRSA